MNPGITRWNELPLKWRSLPDRPNPFSPVHKHRKFSTVLGTMSALSSISILPFGEPPIVMSKNTTGFSLPLMLVVSLFVSMHSQFTIQPNQCTLLLLGVGSWELVGVGELVGIIRYRNRNKVRGWSLLKHKPRAQQQ